MSAASEPARRAPSRGPAARRARRGQPERHLEQRLEELLETIQEYASLRFSVRAPIGPEGDLIDAIAGGVNFLGEELEASFSELERRVADRTAELSLATRELRRRALHDELTGLPNRALFWDHVAHRLESASRRATGFAVMFLDIDNFKSVNDTLGHATGDQLLIAVASRLRSALRAGDAAARVGGDEFVVLIDDVASPAAAQLVGERLVEALREPYEIAGRALDATASIGIMMVTDEGLTPDEVVAAADAAMYDAKRRGGARCVPYRPGLHGPQPR